MQKAYVVLTEAERAKGFVRPVRRTYVHVGKPSEGLFVIGVTHGQAALEHLTDEAGDGAHRPDPDRRLRPSRRRGRDARRLSRPRRTGPARGR